MSELDYNQTSTVGEDQLLKQIDDFRDKAMQLTKLINLRERRVKELEATVRAKEVKNQELQDDLQELQISLQKKQEEADSLVVGVNAKVDEIMAEVRDTMQNLETKLTEQVSSNDAKVAEQQQAVQEAVQTSLDSMNEGLGDIKSELSEKVHTENVKAYRNIQDLLQEMDKREEDNAVLNKKLKGLKGTTIFLTILSLVNLGAVGFMILMMLGII